MAKNKLKYGDFIYSNYYKKIFKFLTYEVPTRYVIVEDFEQNKHYIRKGNYRLATENEIAKEIAKKLSNL